MQGGALALGDVPIISIKRNTFENNKAVNLTVDFDLVEDQDIFRGGAIFVSCKDCEMLSVANNFTLNQALI